MSKILFREKLLENISRMPLQHKRPISLWLVLKPLFLFSWVQTQTKSPVFLAVKYSHITVLVMRMCARGVPTSRLVVTFCVVLTSDFAKCLLNERGR